MKKFLSVFFSVLAVYSLYILFTTSNQPVYSGYDPTASARQLGRTIGSVYPVVLYIISAVFLFRFDNIYNKSYTDGFEARKKQCTFSIVMCILFVFPAMLSFFSFGAYINRLDGYIPGIILVIISGCIPYIIPMVVFSMILDVYYMPYRLSKKLYLNSNTAIEEYLGSGAVYDDYSANSSVLANEKVLFLPKLFCVIPISEIKDIKSILPFLITIKLHNGKSFVMYTTHYNDITKAVSANHK